jgi:prevent-host-death family protein
MTKVPITYARRHFAEIARQVEAGKTVTVTRNGRPILDLVPHRRKGGVDLAAGEAFLRQRGVDKFFKHVADDFDEPLPEDFLLRRLPE